ncbi:hypothetical protein [Pseudomonas gingeri]|uniref:Uncharacterized protein n=1 Tax=Pseudomonas gingeri TaxID=117681 RepID=A0A7Y7WMX6_9PSED|nr:hypothetical protein [Pseudomonas gingeri]NWB84142.1 hypothetical protein [Pseudomonas gingeri]
MTAWWMSEGNNPVGKLLRFAEEGARIQGTMTTNDAWAAIFGCHIVDTLKIARGISDIYELVQAGKKAIIDNAKGEITIYLTPLFSIEVMLTSCDFISQWQDCKNYLNCVTLQGLVFGNHLLSNCYPAADAEIRQKIITFTEKLSKLLQECLDSDLSDELKRLFTKHIEAIHAGLLSYLAGGPDKIEELSDQAVGAIVRNVSEIQEASPEGQRMAKKVLETLSVTNQIITKTQELATRAHPIIENLLPFITT